MRVNKNVKLLLLSTLLIITTGSLIGCSNKEEVKKENSQNEQSNTAYNNIPGDEAVKLMEDSEEILILDVRNGDEYASGHIKNAINIPSEDIENKLNEIESYKDKTVLIYCKSGKRSENTAKMLQEKGFTKVYNSVDGVAEYDFDLVK